MKVYKYILIAIICTFALSIKAQTKRELEETYRDANSYFYFEDYEEALALYLQVYASQPNNANLCYRIGFCYLNIPGSKGKSLPFLKQAVNNTTRHYSEESVIETKAPVDAIFYLGNAYFFNNQIENALTEYKRFSDATRGKGNWNMDYYNHQVSTAKNSTVLKKTPVNFLRYNLGDKVNDRFDNYNPIISGDGKTLAFTTKRRFYQAIFISTLNSSGEWNTPKNITLDLQVDGNCSTLSLSYDGTELYLFKDDNHDGNIYVSHFKNGIWSPMAKLNKNINSESYETHACISPDGKKLFFTSNRKGGYGDLDIYMSERSTGDEWGIPQNLGPTINTNYNENTPFISTDGNILYFSSEGHNNMGGYDIFISQIDQNGDWSQPINLGYPINTTDDNLFFFPIGDGSKGLLATFDPEGYGNQDICEVELFIPKFMKNIVSSTSFSDRIPGKATYRQIVVDTLNTNGIALLDITNSDIPLNLDPEKHYKLFFEGKGFDIREKAKFSERMVARAEQVQAEKLPSIVLLTDSTDNDTLIKAPIMHRINLLKQFSDTNIRTGIAKNINVPDSQSQNEFLRETTAAVTTDNNNLLEMFLILTPESYQSILSKILKNGWKFDVPPLNVRIIEFSQAFTTDEEKEAMVSTLALFADKLSRSNIKSLSKRSKNIAAIEASNPFYFFYNQLINAASSELSKQLATVLVNNPNMLSIEDLIRNYQKDNPDGYRTHLKELLRILAQSAIGAYINLPENEKFNLYNDITQVTEEKTTRWWILIAMAFVVISGLGYYIFSRKNNKNEPAS